MATRVFRTQTQVGALAVLQRIFRTSQWPSRIQTWSARCSGRRRCVGEPLRTSARLERDGIQSAGRTLSLVPFRALIAKPPGQADKALWSPPTGPGATAPPSARRALALALFEAGVPTCAPSALPAVPCIPTWNVMGRRCAVAWPRRRVLGRCGRWPRAARYPARRGQQPRARRNSLICSVNRPFTCGDCVRACERARGAEKQSLSRQFGPFASRLRTRAQDRRTQGV